MRRFSFFCCAYIGAVDGINILMKKPIENNAIAALVVITIATFFMALS
jgi:hypothetical protein